MCVRASDSQRAGVVAERQRERVCVSVCACVRVSISTKSLKTRLDYRRVFDWIDFLFLSGRGPSLQGRSEGARERESVCVCVCVCVSEEEAGWR
jgi:hypothetical protein